MLKKSILRFIFVFFLLLATISNGFCADKKVIGLFIHRNQNDMFLKNIVTFATIAANQLGMKIRPYYANGDQFLMQKQLKEALTGPNKVDAVAIPNYKQEAPLFIKMANDAKTPIIIINIGLSASERNKLKQSGQNYKYWIGELTPNDFDAGYIMSEHLIKAAKPAKDGKIHMIALEGFHYEYSSLQRVLGLNKSLKEHPSVVLDRLVSTKWNINIAKNKFIELKRFYPDASAIWAASDGIGIGVIQGAKELNLTPGKDIYTTGVDWTKEGLANVKNKTLLVSVGGHYIEGAWVTVLFYDYFHGIKFKTNGETKLTSAMVPLTSKNINEYQRKMNPNNWKNINFKKFSKKLNPALKEYNFSPYAVLNQLK